MTSNNFDLHGKSYLITGGTGSFGKQMVRTLLDTYEPARVVVFSRDELKQYEMAEQFPPSEYPALRYFIGDVRDEARLRMAMRGIDVVIHAAALKHVTAAEYNPFECIATNVMGAENVVNAALATDVKRVIALSTDKAVNPVNLYGASKLAADKIFTAANNLIGQSPIRFASVRYGNVLGSRGSVVPLFRRLVADGVKEIPITDPRMTRFWITLQEGVDFVLSSLQRMNGGEIFVPKIASMKITDLAEAIAPGIPCKTVGIRPGEKLHEVMVSEDDARHTLDQGDRYVIEPEFNFWSREAQDGTPLAEGFRYASDLNDQWLSVDELRDLLDTLDD